MYDYLLTFVLCSCRRNTGTRSYLSNKRGSMSGTGDDNSIGSQQEDDSPANEDSPA